MKTLIKSLKENDQDFEFYPTTDEIIHCIRKSMIRENLDSVKMLDIGAGNGNVFKVLDSFVTKDEDDRRQGLYVSSAYAIEKSHMLIAEMPNEIFVMGTDFHRQTLIDKEVDVIFCNPPYTEYVQWMLKIVSEANASFIYLVVPERWKYNPQIVEMIKARTNRNEDYYEVLDSFDFMDSKYRKARAKVDVIKIKMKTRNRYGSETESDPFNVWFNSYFKIKTVEKDDRTDYQNKQSKSEQIRELVKGHNLIERLEELYNEDMKRLLKNYKAVELLDAELLKELSVNVSGLRQGLKEKINGLKNLYWKELFDNLSKITNRLTTSSRKSILSTLTAHTNIDYTIDNAYAIIMWAIKNSNKYIDSQLVEVYKDMTEKKNIINYRSNEVMITDTWRYAAQKHTHYKLDYRIVCERWGCFSNCSYDTYDYPNGLAKTVHDFLNDICTIGENLGFKVCDSSYDFNFEPGKTIEFNYQDGEEYEVFMSVKAYKKGTVHLKINQRFMRAFNVEAARLNKWVKSPEEMCVQADMNFKDVFVAYGANTKIDLKQIKQLV